MMKKIVNFLFPVIIVFSLISPSFSQNWGGNRASSVVVEPPIRENLATPKDISAKVVSSISYCFSFIKWLCIDGKYKSWRQN